MPTAYCTTNTTTTTTGSGTDTVTGLSLGSGCKGSRVQMQTAWLKRLEAQRYHGEPGEMLGIILACFQIVVSASAVAGGVVVVTVVVVWEGGINTFRCSLPPSYVSVGWLIDALLFKWRVDEYGVRSTECRVGGFCKPSSQV